MGTKIVTEFRSICCVEYDAAPVESRYSAGGESCTYSHVCVQLLLNSGDFVDYGAAPVELGYLATGESLKTLWI